MKISNNGKGSPSLINWHMKNKNMKYEINYQVKLSVPQLICKFSNRCASSCDTMFQRICIRFRTNRYLEARLIRYLLEDIIDKMTDGGPGPVHLNLLSF